ncbi:MAG TPA: hypothetical protein VJV39_09165, partial [Dongiaceae bacterium]|nr:hypothetical protein [Dongiaceae bacterium]
NDPAGAVIPPSDDIPLDVRTNRAEQEARKFIAEQHKLMREAEKLRADMKWEARKFVVTAIAAAAGLIGAGVLLGRFIAF